MPRRRIHIQAEAPQGRGEVLTYCGRAVWGARTTPLARHATCQSCIEAYDWGEPQNPVAVEAMDTHAKLEG